jgi:hypothetical protein
VGERGYHGGCLCGRVRYASDLAPVDAGYCHCRNCQRSGAPVLAFCSFPAATFRYQAQPPRAFRSSGHGQREFCPSCGTQIAYRDDDGLTVDVNLGSLDDPASVRPTHHVFTESRIAWFETADDLPRYAGSSRAAAAQPY